MYGAWRPFARAIWARAESYSAGSGGNAVRATGSALLLGVVVAHRSMMPPTSATTQDDGCPGSGRSRAGH